MDRVNQWCDLFLPSDNNRNSIIFEYSCNTLINDLLDKYQSVVEYLYNIVWEDVNEGREISAKEIKNACQFISNKRWKSSQVVALDKILKDIDKRYDNNRNRTLDLEDATIAYINVIDNLDISFTERYILAQLMANYVLWKYGYSVCLPYIDYDVIDNLFKNRDNIKLIVSNNIGFSLDKINNIIVMKHGRNIL